MPDLTRKQVDDYLLLQPLGRGSFGEVYKVEHSPTKKIFALKVLNFHLDTQNIRAFLSEARSALLQHPNIVHVHDFGYISGCGIDDGRPYIVMQYAPHGNLRERHPKGSRLSWEIIASYIKQVANALQYIHEKGLVHRDIKPENMLIGSKEEILLSDFGITTTSMTWREGIFQEPMGTLAYVPPEQINGQAVRASDQYSLGAVIYEWLTGEQVFTGSQNRVVFQHINTPPTPLRQKAPIVPAILEAIVMKMLAKDPQDRFTSIREFVSALEDTNVLRPTQPQHVFMGHSEAVQTVAWSHDGSSIASAGQDQVVHIWQPDNGNILYTYREHHDAILSVAWSPTNTHLASAGIDKTIHVWQTTTGKQLTVFKGHDGPVRAVAWSHNGALLASVSEDKTLQIWQPNNSGKLYCETLVHKADVCACCWSPDDNFVATGDSMGNVSIWEITTGNKVREYAGDTEKVKSVDWSPNSKYIISSGYDNTISVWDIAIERPIYSYKAHTDPVVAIAWSPNGKTVASASWDRTVHVWEIDGEMNSFIYTKHINWVNTLSWSPDSKSLASGSWDSTVHIFRPSAQW